MGETVPALCGPAMRDVVALCGNRGTVPDMHTLISAPRPTGHLAVVRLPQGAKFTAVYVDDDPGQAREITALVAELILSGALNAMEVRASAPPAPAEEVEAVTVSYSEPLLPGQVRGAASFTWVHAPSGKGGDFEPHEVLSLIARGIAVELTAAVAAEAAQGSVPDTAEELNDPHTNPAAT